MNLASGRSSSGRLVALGFALLTLLAALAFAGRAQAAETIYWNNYSANPDNVAFADITGSGGGLLNLGGGTLDNPEGMAYDTATNRLFVSNTNGANGEILAINLDGSGGVAFTAPGALIDEPEGVAVDPVRRLLFWVNTTGEGSIGWAKLDGSAGGLLNTAGATVDDPYRGIAVDTVGGKVYWSNSGPSPEVISYANADGSGGGGNLDIGGATPSEITGLAVDPAAGRIYWLDNEEEKIGYASLAPGGNGGEVNLTGAAFDDPYGFAFDPSIGRFYLGNYGVGDTRTDAIGVVNLAGGGGGITPATVPVNGPQDPVVIKSPIGTGAPTITPSPTVRSELTCSTGSWGADYAGSNVYQAPRSFTYQWSNNGTAIPGATATTFNANTPGQYTCTVTATNHVGSATQSSAATPVKASKVRLSTKKKAKADPGDLVTFQVKAVNQGDVSSKGARICVKLPKAAKDDLRKPKCKKLRPLTGAAKRTTKFRIKVKPGADEGADKLTFQVKGTPGKAAKSKIIVR